MDTVAVRSSLDGSGDAVKVISVSFSVILTMAGLEVIWSLSFNNRKEKKRKRYERSGAFWSPQRKEQATLFSGV